MTVFMVMAGLVLMAVFMTVVMAFTTCKMLCIFGGS